MISDLRSEHGHSAIKQFLKVNIKSNGVDCSEADKDLLRALGCITGRLDNVPEGYRLVSRSI